MAQTKEEIFRPENKITAEQKTYTSPSGRYRLQVTPYETGKGYWNLTEGIVFGPPSKDVPSGIIEVVQRNYAHFWHCWVEPHSDGHSYLLCGEDYQGQTVIQLDTGKRIDYLPKEAKKGWGFCWIAVEPIEDDQLIVDGCYWGAPEERLIVDFSKPMELPYPVVDRYYIYEDEEE